MSHKQIFGAQIKNNILDNHTDQREMVLLFSLFFFRCCNEQGDHEWFFFSDWWLDGPKEDDKLQGTILRAAKWNVFWLQMIYTYTFDLNHAIFFFRHADMHAAKPGNKIFALWSFSSKTWRDKFKSVISAFADEHLLANYLGISVYPFKPCRVTVKENSIVLLTYSSFNGKNFP